MALRLGALAATDAWALAQRWGPPNGVDPALLMGVMQVESGFEPTARGAAGEGGIMQMLPNTATQIAGRPVTAAELASNPDLAVQLGAKYLSDQIARFGSTAAGVAAYNAGTARQNSAGQFVNSEGRTTVNDYVNHVMDATLAYAGSVAPDGGVDLTATVEATAPPWWQNPWTLVAGSLVMVAGLVVITDN